MKKIKIFTAFSLVLNLYLLFDFLMVRKDKEHSFKLDSGIENITWHSAFRQFSDTLKKHNPTSFKKKYYYINVWASFCNPCFKEMPYLDSLAGTLKSDVAYIFLSELSDLYAIDVLNRKNIQTKNFLYLNNQNNFVSGICNENKIKTKAYPMKIVLDQKGNIYHFSLGGYSNDHEFEEFIKIISNLP